MPGNAEGYSIIYGIWFEYTFIIALIKYTGAANKGMGNTAFVALKNGDVDKVRNLFSVSGNLDVNAMINGATALSWASKFKKIDVVKVLLDMNANVNQKCDRGNTALHVCVMENSVEILCILIAAGANIDAKNDDGITPAHVACQYGYAMVLKKLIEKGADVNSQDKQGITPFHVACTMSNHEILVPLLESGADFHAVTNDGSSPLHFACRHDRLPIIQFLIFNNMGLNIPNNLGHTALHDACVNGNADSAHVLMICGADTTGVDKNGRTALQCSSFETSGTLNLKVADWSARVAEFSEPIEDLTSYLESLNIPPRISGLYAAQMVITHRFDSLSKLRDCCKNDPAQIKNIFKEMGMEKSVSSKLVRAFSGASCLLS